MKRLEPKNPTEKVNPIFLLTGKERLVRDIQDFIGKDGCVSLEHSYRPTLNVQSFDYNGMVLRFSIGRKKRTRIEYSEMDEKMLNNVVVELFRYYNFCQHYC